MTKKIKVLLTIPNFDTAGSGKVVYDLARGLDKKFFEVFIACNHNKGRFFKEVQSLGIPITLIEVSQPLRPYYSLIHRLRTYRSFLRENNIDIVHSWHWSSDWSEPLAVRLVKAKFVYTKKAMSWGNRHWKIRSFLSHFIVTVNSDMRQFFPRKKQQKLIPFGIDLNHYKKTAINIKRDSVFKIITVANLVPVKAIEVLLMAIKQLDKKNIHLDIIGDDTLDYAVFLKNKIEELGLADKVSFLGKHNDVRPFLESSDLYVITSKQEGMPMALVEAMAMELPVLGSNISGVRDLLIDFDHLLFEPNNSEALSERIFEIYRKDKKEREALGKALRTYCMEHFSFQKFIKNHEELYKNLVDH